MKKRGSIKQVRPWLTHSDDYIGTVLPFTFAASGGNVLTKDQTDMLRKMEHGAQRRAHKFDDAEVVPVDFIAVCIRQNWKCCICGKWLNPFIRIPAHDPLRISVEHDPALWESRSHTDNNVHAAHQGCNSKKSQTIDNPRCEIVTGVKT